MPRIEAILLAPFDKQPGAAMVSAMQGCNYWFPSIACILALLAGSVLVVIEQVARHDENAGRNLSL